MRGGGHTPHGDNLMNQRARDVSPIQPGGGHSWPPKSIFPGPRVAESEAIHKGESSQKIRQGPAYLGPVVGGCVKCLLNTIEITNHCRGETWPQPQTRGPPPGKCGPESSCPLGESEKEHAHAESAFGPTSPPASSLAQVHHYSLEARPHQSH